MTFFTDLEQRNLHLNGKAKDSEQPKQSWEIKMELEGSGSLTSNYTTKRQQSEQYGTGTKLNI